MSRYTEFDPDRLELLSFSDLPHTISTEQFAAPPRIGASFLDFWDSLPKILAGASIRTVAQRVGQARARGRAVVAACGAHVVKCGLTPVVIALMREGFITALAMSGATAIHDVEIALFGATSEVVADGLLSGRFGMARETAEFFNAAIASAYANAEGAGEALGRALLEQNAPNAGDSLLAAAYSLGIPVTVHVAIGTDVVNMHGSTQGAALGESSLRDFRILTAAMALLADGGVLLNLGSAVVLPEVFLKAMACLRNTMPSFTGFLGVNVDMLQHYRANEQVVKRVEAIGGEGISLTGHHEIMIPLLAHAIFEQWNAEYAEPGAVQQVSRHARNGGAHGVNGNGSEVPLLPPVSH